MTAGENPYASPSAILVATNREIAMRRLRIPAICLLIIGSLMLLFLCLAIAFELFMVSANQEEAVEFQLNTWRDYWYVYVMIISSNAVVVYAAIQMLRVRQYAACVTGAVIAVIPLCSPCYVLGIPFAIWALIVLLRSDTRAAFAEAT